MNGMIVGNAKEDDILKSNNLKHLRMETKKKLNRKIHGEGQKISPNMHRVTVYLYNPPRKGNALGKGSKDFKTTHTFKDIDTHEKAMEIINHFAEGMNNGHISYSMIKRAYYNGECLVYDGLWLDKN